MRAALVDTGPLVALLDRSDAAHQSCVEALKSLPAPLLTVWPVMVEAMYLVGGWEPQAQLQLWNWLEDGALKLCDLLPEDFPRLRTLMEKYRNLPMDLADAALVRVAERERIADIFTLDRRDFSVYRLHRVGRFRLIPV